MGCMSVSNEWKSDGPQRVNNLAFPLTRSSFEMEQLVYRNCSVLAFRVHDATADVSSMLKRQPVYETKREREMSTENVNRGVENRKKRGTYNWVLVVVKEHRFFHFLLLLVVEIAHIVTDVFLVKRAQRQRAGASLDSEEGYTHTHSVIHAC